VNKPDDHLTTSQRLRKVIRQARNACGRTQDEVDKAFADLMREKGLEAPKSIMTKVRDKRRDFSFSNDEAQCLARALKIPPHIILEAQNPLFEEDAVFASNTSNPAPAPASKNETPAIPSAAGDKPENTTSEAGTASFHETDTGLTFALNMELSAVQFERLTLAIPAYMMKIDKSGDRYRCQASVSIFPYQAELVMRAIFGGR